MKENSIEEDITLIEKSLCDKDTIIQYHYWVGTDFLNAVERIVADYKKVLKENEELKEEREIVGIPVRNKRDGKIGIVLHQWKNGSVAVLESINPRVINTHDSWNTLEIVTDEVKQTQTKCETIPIQKVKDKIEELKKKVEELTDDKGYWGGSDLLEQIKVLQELLEKEK